MTSTPSSVSALATSSFSSVSMLHPGDCSPSRSVVSKMVIVSDMAGVRYQGLGALIQQKNPEAPGGASGWVILHASSEHRPKTSWREAGEVDRG
jgi:hypothetical protein